MANFKRLGQQERRVDARQGPMERDLHRLFQSVIRRNLVEVEQEFGLRTKDRVISKREKTDIEKLVDLFLRHGLRFTIDEANTQAGEKIIQSSFTMTQLRHQQFPIKLLETLRADYTNKAIDILEQLQTDIRNEVRRIILEEEEKIPRPTNQSIARRIRNDLINQPDDDKRFAFSQARAATIARTELGKAQANGEALAIVSTNEPEDFIQWMSRSGGGRGHGLMDGKRISIADMESGDPSRWFELPDGTRTPYPKWSGLPAKHMINCRCGKRVIKKQLA